MTKIEPNVTHEPWLDPRLEKRTEGREIRKNKPEKGTNLGQNCCYFS